MKKLKYKNITISGLPGAGSSALGKKMAKKLGWEYFSGGDFMREHAIKEGLFDKDNSLHHEATVYGDDFDREVDHGMRKTLQTKRGKVLDSWLSGFVAQGVKGVLKILVYCDSDAVRVDRIVNRDGVDIKTAKEHIFDRELKNIAKWKKMYKKEWKEWVGGGKIDFYNRRLYDLCIDTYSLSREETLKKALKFLGYAE